MNITVMRRAFARRDPAFDGVFFAAVKTTGIFCRPTCTAKMPRPENVEFFASAREAMHAGYRACKRCRPLDAGGRPPAVVERLVAAVERGNDPARLGIDPSTARRAFRRWCGMTFAQYRRARRLGAAMSGLRKGGRVIEAQIESGYESASGFREAFAKVFGRPPARADGAALAATWLETPLGGMLAVAGDDGVRMLDFVDRRGLERAIARFRAPVVPGTNAHLEQLRRELAEYFAGTRSRFDVAVAPVRGTPFQRRAWEYLRKIPYGETRTYADEARAIGSPGAVRAVGSANGMNFVAIVVPCHRVIASDGSLAGYGGGLARKRWLLGHESRIANRESQKTVRDS
jgi:AraC family transcriptional regulator of adaptative response/methylated-DNA-[protein]-cysteine methyltransferase